MQEANYMHLDVGEGKITAAIGITEKPQTKLEVARVSLSFCSPLDQFCRKTGRLISSGRLHKGKHFYEFTLAPNQKVSTQVRNVIKEAIMAKDARFPSWALVTLR
jgi:hypothetical protein